MDRACIRQAGETSTDEKIRYVSCCAWKGVSCETGCIRLPDPLKIKGATELLYHVTALPNHILFNEFNANVSEAR